MQYLCLQTPPPPAVSRPKVLYGSCTLGSVVIEHDLYISAAWENEVDGSMLRNVSRAVISFLKDHGISSSATKMRLAAIEDVTMTESACALILMDSAYVHAATTPPPRIGGSSPAVYFDIENLQRTFNPEQIFVAGMGSCDVGDLPPAMVFNYMKSSPKLHLKPSQCSAFLSNLACHISKWRNPRKSDISAVEVSKHAMNILLRKCAITSARCWNDRKECMVASTAPSWQSTVLLTC